MRIYMSKMCLINRMHLECRCSKIQISQVNQGQRKPMHVEDLVDSISEGLPIRLKSNKTQAKKLKKKNHQDHALDTQSKISSRALPI